MSKKINTKDNLLKKQASKPRSDLAILSAEVNWFTGCRLQEISGLPRDLRVSANTWDRLNDYNTAIMLLKDAIRQDYHYQRQTILTHRENLIKSNKEREAANSKQNIY